MSLKQKRILMQGGNSIKTFSWGEAAKRNNLGVIQVVAGTPAKIPFVLIKSIIQGKKTDAVFFRYLNDHKSLILTLIRTLSEVSTLLIARIFHIKIFWICHNVDKESIENYPLLTQFRRWNLKISSQKIFVTDDLLVNPCVDILKVSKSKVKAISFGRTDAFNFIPNDSKLTEYESSLDEIKSWIQLKKLNYINNLFGLWIGSPADKKLSGLAAIPKIINEQKQNNSLSENNLAFIIIGSISSWLNEKDPDLLKFLRESENIFILDKQIDIPSKFWPDICNFIWKPYDDLSVPFTAYNAATVCIPLVAFKDSFLGDFVLKYKLGFAIDPSSEALMYYQLVNSLENWQSNISNQEFADFLRLKTWDNSANLLFDF